MSKELVIFDMSGLVFDTEKVIFDSYIQAFASQGLEFTYEDYVHYAGSSQKENLQLTCQRAGSQDLGQKIYDHSYQIRMDIFMNEGAPVKPGIIDLLEGLEQAGVEAIIASSNDLDLIQALLDHAQIGSYFSHVVSGEDLERAKPDPQIFIKALDKTGYRPDQAICLEDSLNGIQAAKGAGIDVIMIPDQVQPNDYAEANSLAILDTADQALEYIL